MSISWKEEEKLRTTRRKCLRLARDPSVTKEEKETAETKAEELRLKIIELTNTDPDKKDDEYDKLVTEGISFTIEQTDINWKLGELATRVDKKYGEGRLKQFAEDIGIKYQSLINCRTTLLAWPQKTGRPVFSIAEALNPHPNRFKIIESFPNITREEARKRMQQFRDYESAKAARAAEKEAAKKPKSNLKSVARTPEPEPEPELDIDGVIENITDILRRDSATATELREISKSKEVTDKDRTRIAKELGKLQTRVNDLVKLFEA
jgi:hypothetical protein